MNRLAKTIAHRLVQNGADPEMEEVYAYGIECTLSTLLILALLMGAGFILRKPVHMLVFIAAWLPLRMLVGGAHANTHWACTLVSVGLGTVSVWLSDYISIIPAAVLIAIAVCCYSVFFLTAPVVHKNQPYLSKAISQNADHRSYIHSRRMHRYHIACAHPFAYGRPRVHGILHNGAAGCHRMVQQGYG